MIVIPIKDKWLKKFIAREKMKELLKASGHYGWIFINYLYIPKNAEGKGGIVLCIVSRGYLSKINKLT
jgi:hypothetical protein